MFLIKILILGRKDGNVLFNDTLNTFYLWLYGVKHMVKTIQIVRGNPLIFPISSKGFFYLQDNKYHGLCYTSKLADRNLD